MLLPLIGHFDFSGAFVLLDILVERVVGIRQEG